MAAKRSVDNVFDHEKLDIFKAILNGDASLVAKCVDGGCDVDRPGADGLTPLCAAIRNGESEIACLIIPHACLFRKEKTLDDSSISSLFRAFFLDDERHRFINNRIGNHLLNGIWRSLGFVATQSVLNILLSRFDARVMSVLHLNNFRVYSAIRTNIVRRYVSWSIVPVIEDASKQDQMSLQCTHRGTNLTVQGYTALDHLLEYGGNTEPVMLEMLIAGLVFDNVNKIDGYALRIWEWAASKGHMNVVTILQGMGIDPDAKSGLALGIACYKLNAGLCKYLLHSGASVNLRQCSENGCLWLVSENPAIVQCAKGIIHGITSNYNPQVKPNAFSIMEALIDYGEDINQTGQSGETALSIVCVNSNCQEMVMFLLNHGALPNIADKKGSTPLHKASQLIQAPLLTKMLLEAGANPNVIDERGRTPMNSAAFDGVSVLNLQLLVDAADPAYLDWDTLLYQASKYGCLEMLEYLLSKGANPTTEVEEDDCALFAVMNKCYQYKEATLLLLHHKASHDLVTNSSRSSLHHMLGERKALELGDFYRQRVMWIREQAAI